MLALPAAKESGPSTEPHAAPAIELPLSEVTGPSLKGVEPSVLTRAQTLASLDPSTLSRTEAAQILGIGETSDVKTVKSGYRAVARSFHPDAHPEASPAEREVLEAASKVVNGAKDVLLAAPEPEHHRARTESHRPSEEPHEARGSPDEEYQRPSSSQRRHEGPKTDRVFSMEQELRSQHFDSLLSYYFAATVGASTGEHLSRKIEHEISKGGTSESLAQQIVESFDQYLGREILGLNRRALSPAGQEAAFRKLESSLERLGQEDLAASLVVTDRLVKAGVISKEDGAALVKGLIGEQVQSILETKGRDEKHLASLLEKVAPALEKSGLMKGEESLQGFLVDSVARDGEKRGRSLLQTTRDAFLVSAALETFTERGRK